MPSGWEKIVSMTKSGMRIIGQMKRKVSRGKRIALLIDGPNILRKELGVKLEDIAEALSEIGGDIRVAKVILNQYAPQGGLIEQSQISFEPIIVSGETGVKLAVEAMKEIYNPHIDVIALATRNAEFLPVILKAKEKGKETVVIGVEPGFSVALKHAADYTIILGGEEE
ncbi:TIGR00288 family NYN domain-containing protein [Thermococcus sp. JCM 11816]|uniref:TIGR00288 family NYN domain-containing protein n=1 Tax=Thermococcus sp. (strain JCM 11816 / KS-1) TaxID=1295125 RepID=UPI0006D16BC4